MFSADEDPVPFLACVKKTELVMRIIMSPTFPRDRYDFVHLCVGIDAFREEFPKIMEGTNYSAASGLGSNVNSEHPQKPKIVIAGSGFSDDEVDELERVKYADSVTWYRAPTTNKDIFGPDTDLTGIGKNA
ncbi:hypothetical protein G7K_4631-t1 [Saitoella complicata NRRL Y-17804]|uniref:Uncharacterized protein n=1 Tax=Saitoella complicata (strain BCRC 22490 / CBS 7301 / JCM 7358 / NBRC 10748 / NRRL Y-17804) TaxID=698492 RepID=A0A0E9NKV4_SAICN|nr:hypothetical protein G7K_4631-t1 [Saitoella complicata NRRL Y-17804]